jgi:hypothetical protein
MSQVFEASGCPPFRARGSSSVILRSSSKRSPLFSMLSFLLHMIQVAIAARYHAIIIFFLHSIIQSFLCSLSVVQQTSNMRYQSMTPMENFAAFIVGPHQARLLT